MLNDRPFNTRPLYQQVADEFVARIVSGRWALGQTIDNEADIARSLGVSLGTARKAFDILVDLDILERQQGRGTTVSDVRDEKYRARFSNLRDRSGRRVTGTVEVCDVALCEPSPRAAEALGVNARTPVLAFRRVRRHEGRVFMVEDVALRVEAAARDLSLQALNELALQGWTHADIATAKRETVTVLGAGPEDCALFDVAPGAPLLGLDRVVSSYQERALEWRSGRCNPGDDLVYVAG